MPVILTDKSYTDIYGNTSSYFKANAGDTINVKYTFSTEIFAMSTSTNSMTFSKLNRTLTQAQGSFLDEGFRVGQTYTFKDVNNTNGVTLTFSGTILSVSHLTMELTGLPDLNNATNVGSTWCIFVEQIRSSIELGVNFVDNTLTSPSLESLIDGETNRFIVDNVDSMGQNSTQTLTQIGKKSGGFTFSNPTLKRISDIVNPYTFTHNKQVFELTFQVIFHGMFDESWFTGQNCLKIYSKIDLKVIKGEPFGASVLEIKESSDTGFFDTGFNTEIPNVVSKQIGTSSVYYNESTSIPFTIVCNSTAINAIQFGAMYVTLDDDVNKNKFLPQEEYLQFAKSPLWNASNVTNYVYSSIPNSRFFIQLESFNATISGTQKIFTGTLQFAPLGFSNYMSTKGENDRLVYIWAKVGNTNALLFSGQLEYAIPVGTLIQPNTSALFNHNWNNNYSDFSTPPESTDLNIEDDLGYITDFLIYEEDINDSVNVSIIATDSTKEVELESITFNLFDKDLNYFVPTYLDVANNLPDSSKKKTAYLIQKTPIFRGTLEVRLYYPFLIRWEYWINQQNVPPYFIASQKDNKNWFNYQSTNPAWSVKIKVEIIRNGVVDYFYKDFSFKNYNDSLVTSEIKLYNYETNTQTNALLEDKIMLIKAIHTFPTPYTMTPWGQITIEPKESSPRHVLSTEMDRSTSNPLKGISNEERLDIEYTSPTIVTLSCLLDTSKLTGNGYCFTSKISDGGTGENTFEEFKITEDNIEKITEENINKIIE